MNEGSNATFLLQTTNVASGTLLTYVITGVSSSDIVGGSLTGTVVVSSGPYVNETCYGTISIPIAADMLTEGTEYITVTVQNAYSALIVYDTSTTQIATYGLAAGSS